MSAGDSLIDPPAAFVNTASASASANANPTRSLGFQLDLSGADIISVADSHVTDPFDDHVDTTADSYELPIRLPRKGFCGFCRESEEERYERVLVATALSRMQKNSIRRRYFELLRDFRLRCRIFSLLFHIGHFTITVGSLVVPALLSVQYAGSGVTFIDANSFQAQVYWTTWILSLLVTMFNGVLVLFKVDMKYYFLHTTLERLRSEGWQYLELTGRYAGALTHIGEMPTHRNQFRYFCHYIEKIKLKQVEEEYYKYEDSQKNAVTGAAAVAGAAGATGTVGAVAGAGATGTGAGAGAGTGTGGGLASPPAETPAGVSVQEQRRDLPLYPPSIDKNLSSLTDQAPPSVQEAIRGIVKSQKSIASMNHMLPQYQAANSVIIPAKEHTDAFPTPAQTTPAQTIAVQSRVADAQITQSTLPVLAPVRRTST